MAGITLGTNISSLAAQRGVAKATSEVTKAFERLSSGMRINHASDDAAGLGIASSLSASAKVFAQGIRNINDAISATSISEGALGSLSQIAQRQLELAEQAANGSYSFNQRKAMNREADSLTEEFNRIIQTTSFNGIQLLSTFGTSLSVQAGYGTGGSISALLNTSLARTTGDGTFGAPISVTGVASLQAVTTADFNGDGFVDIAISASNKVAIRLGNGDGTFSTGVSLTTTGAGYYVQSGDLNGDGKADLVVPSSTNSGFYAFLGNGDGTFSIGISYATAANIFRSYLGDVNNDGRLDVVSTTGAGTSYSVSIGNGDGSFRTGISYSSGALNNDSLTLGDFNGDNKIDLAVGDFNTGNVLVHLGNGDGTFRSSMTFVTGTAVAGRIASSDLNHDGILDLTTADTANSKMHVMLGNGDGTFKVSISYGMGVPLGALIADYNGDGYNDIVAPDNGSTSVGVLINRGDGTFLTNVTYSVGSGNANSGAFGDFNNDGAMDITVATAAGSASVLLGTAVKRTTIAYLDLFSQSSARDSITIARGTVDRISQELGSIGAFTSRFGVAINNLQTQRENYLSAESRIKDADIAGESANLVRQQILQQAGAAVLAQANQAPQLAIKLLN